ncbi:MAG: hypothetical protein F6K55_35035 [Moorea sp. SIO4A3]|nr:hypothetical protein [Moorena sp. SIO4A3]
MGLSTDRDSDFRILGSGRAEIKGTEGIQGRSQRWRRWGDGEIAGSVNLDKTPSTHKD